MGTSFGVASRRAMDSPGTRVGMSYSVHLRCCATHFQARNGAFRIDVHRLSNTFAGFQLVYGAEVR